MQNYYLTLILLFFSFSACNIPERKSREVPLPEIAVKPVDFEAVVDGKEIQLFTLSNKDGMFVQLTNYGASIVSILLPGGNGDYTDVVLGYNSIEGYLADRMSCGCVVGRYANRIGGANFELNGTTYHLEKNQGENTLHSGSSTYCRVVWDAYQSGDTVFMHYVSPHMDGGFPGELHVSVAYVLTADNELRIIYEATTSETTVVNLTNHAYFNLAGEGRGDVSGQYVKINGDYITEVYDDMIPTGELIPVDSTPFDLRAEIPIGRMIDDDHEQIAIGNGYDHNWVLNKNKPGELSFAASVRDTETGFIMEVSTTEPGIQFYTGNYMNGTFIGKSGVAYDSRYGFALEAQHFPDSPNQPEFPSAILHPDEKYHQETVLRFIF